MSGMLNDPSALVPLYQGVQVDAYCQFASAVLIVYDYITTLDREISLYWSRRIDGSTILFALNRYFYMVLDVYTIFVAFLVTDESCKGFSQTTWGIGLVPYLVWATFSTLRAYALSRNWFAALSVFVLSTVIVGMNMSGYHFGLTGMYIPLIGCQITISWGGNAELATSVITAPRVCLIAADIILIYITWSTVHQRREVFQERRPHSLASVLLHDGTIYFVILSVLNCLQMTLSLLSVRDAANNASFVSIFIQPVTSILITRFLFNLQYAKRNAESHEDSTPDGSLGTLVFDRVVGCIDSTIEPGGYLSSDLGQESMELKSFDGVELAGTAASEEGR